MQGYLFQKNDKWFIRDAFGENGIPLHLGERTVVNQDADRLLNYDNNRRVCFEMMGDEVTITHKFPKEHGLEWLSDSSEYPRE